VRAQDLADGPRANPVPEAAQLTLDRTTPQPGLSLASLTISPASSPASGGRPGCLGWVHFLVTMRRCQRSNDPGLTIRCARSDPGKIRASAASIARSAQPILGLGLPRRSTATS